MHPNSWFSPQYTLFCRVMDMSRQAATIWTKTVVPGLRVLFKWATRYCLVDPWLRRQKQTRHNMSSNFASSRCSILFASFVTSDGINLQTFHHKMSWMFLLYTSWSCSHRETNFHNAITSRSYYACSFPPIHGICYINQSYQSLFRIVNLQMLNSNFIIGEPKYFCIFNCIDVILWLCLIFL